MSCPYYTHLRNCYYVHFQKLSTITIQIHNPEIMVDLTHLYGNTNDYVKIELLRLQIQFQ